MKAEFRASDGEQHDTGAIKLAFGRTPSAYLKPVDEGTEDYREIYFRYYIRTDEDWEGGGDKMARLTSMQTAEWAQAMIAHTWSGVNSGADDLVAEPVRGTDAEGNLLSTH